MNGCLITGTDTGVGKTVLTAAIAAQLRRSGERVRALKPVLTGLEEPPGDAWPPDHELLAEVTGAKPDDLVVAAYGPAVSPHLAAELSGRPVSVADLVAGIHTRALSDAVLLVEGVGGLLVPIGGGATVRDLARSLGLPLVVAARPGLGTINHTLLTLEAARRAGLTVAAVVLTPWPAEPGRIERSNRDTIARWGEVEVEVLPRVAAPTPALLADAARHLPLRRWIYSS